MLSTVEDSTADTELKSIWALLWKDLNLVRKEKKKL